MSERETRVELGTLLAGLGAVLLLISLFLDWWGSSQSEGTISAWEALELVDLVLAGLALATLYALATKFSAGDRWPAVPASGVRLAGIVALVLVVVTLIDEPPLLRLTSVDPDLEAGIWLALAGALLMTLGSLLVRFRISFVRADEPATRVHDQADTRPLG